MGQLKAHSAQDVWRLIAGLGGEWLGKLYHPIRHNCHHFCTEICERVGVTDLPAWIGRLAVAADYVLMPVLDALDIKATAAGAAAQGKAEDDLEAEILRAPVRRSMLSVATAVALDFEEKFNWALVKMLMCEAEGLQCQGVNEGTPERQHSLAAFL